MTYSTFRDVKKKETSVSLEIKYTDINSTFLFLFHKNQLIKFFSFLGERNKKNLLINKVFSFLWKPNIFLQANFIFPNIWQEQAVKFWRSLVSCADWLLKCKINLYLTDVRTVTLRDNDRFCIRLVTEFLRKMNKVWCQVWKKMTTWLLTIDWIEESKNKCSNLFD